MVGIPAQETILGTYDVGARIVCACNNFTADGRELFGICSIKNIAMDSGHGGTRTELEDILEVVRESSGSAATLLECLCGGRAFGNL